MVHKPLLSFSRVGNEEARFAIGWPVERLVRTLDLVLWEFFG
jgi:hypothetical protein